MGIERIGYRRLYDAIGCSLADREELHISATMDDLEIEVYFGPRPRLGITVANGGKYIVPGEVSPVLTAEYKKDATQSSYPRHFFTEVLCVKQVDVTQKLSDAFHAKKPEAHNELLRLAERDAELFKTATDLVAGTIGLRFHRQFVLELINENFFALRDEDDWAFRQTGPWMEVLESIALNATGVEAITYSIQAVSQAKATSRRFGASALAWLLRAWAERDPISKFMALFTPIEIVLAAFGGDPDEEKARRENADSIRNLITTHGGSEANKLLVFFNQVMGRQPPSLVSRFEQLAREAKFDGWEADLEAFKRFNSIRNKLLHRGQQQVQLVISVGEHEIQEETRQLEDLAERYVSWVLFKDGVVYPSQWRTQRKKKSDANQVGDW